LGINLPFESEVTERVHRLHAKQRRKIFELFDIDREIALNLLSFTEMMLSLFQETDSSFDGQPFAFYQQREWRLIHHMREGMVWYSLGRHPQFRNPLARARQQQIERVRRSIERFSTLHSNDMYFRNCWLLESVDGFPIRDYITKVVVPAGYRLPAQAILKKAGCSASVEVAEEYGYEPRG
jgi:hypothetical protein